MKTGRNTKTRGTQISTLPNVRISAEDFGPIVNGSIDLRPLTVFVGPSNTGKTYFATLIYALHKILNGFSLLPIVEDHRFHLWRRFRHAKASMKDINVRKEEFHDVLTKLDVEGRPFCFSDLPLGMRDIWQSAHKDPKLWGTLLQAELKRCFDLESIVDLFRLTRHSDKMKLALAAAKGGQPLWHLHMDISESRITTNGSIENMDLLPATWSDSKHQWVTNHVRESIREKLEDNASSDGGAIFEDFVLHLLIAVGAVNGQGTAHYLPAARSGIMQSHRVIASSLVARATRVGLEGFPEVPTFSGVMADFLQQLILYEEKLVSDNLMKDLANTLEREVLDGQIQTNRASAGGYPDFVYRPQKTEENIRLARASSMVSELAPVVLLLRSTISRGDMLIIEEPEAHLHPAAQTEMAKTLGRLVRAGVQVVVTTHSDWLLMEIGNLIREGELEEKIGEPINEQPLPSSLQRNDVGVWLFRKDRSSAGSTVEEIPFDRIEGVEPREYEDVADELYKRSAGLQNQLAETAAGAKYRGE